MEYSFAENLKRKRKEVGMTQRELANRLGVSQNTVSEWETSVRYPAVDKLYDIAKCLNTSANALISEIKKNECKVQQTRTSKIF